MTFAFLYIIGCSFKNRVLRRVRRLRQPRYLAGLVVGSLYLYWFVIRNQFGAARRGGLAAVAARLGDQVVQAIVVAGGAALWATALVAWIALPAKSAFTFSGAEIQFLHTAPVSRRAMVVYRLLRQQVGLVVGVIVATAFSGGLAAAANGRWSYVVGGWLLFTTISLHVIGIGVTKASLEGPRGSRWRAWIPIGLMAISSAVVLAVAAAEGRALAALPLDRAFGAAVALGSHGLLHAAWWPFQALVAPIVAPDTARFVPAVAAGMGLLAVHYVWVIEYAVRVQEEPALAPAREARGRTRPAPITVRRPPFRLAPVGRPEVAVVWKNLILAGRHLSIAAIVRISAVVVLLAVVLRSGPATVIPGMMAAMLAAMLTVIGPQLARHDLRCDMPRLAALKTWPVAGASLVAGEVLAPVATLTVLVWGLIAVAIVLLRSWRDAPIGFPERLLLGGVAALLAPPVIVGQVLIQNAAVVLFPGWVQTGTSRARGVEAMGQNMLMFAATALALALGLLPAAAVAGAIGFVLYRFVGLPGLLPAAVIAAAILLAEAAVAVWWLGRVLDRTDADQVEVPD